MVDGTAVPLHSRRNDVHQSPRTRPRRRRDPRPIRNRLVPPPSRIGPTRRDDGAATAPSIPTIPINRLRRCSPSGILRPISPTRCEPGVRIHRRVHPTRRARRDRETARPCRPGRRRPATPRRKAPVCSPRPSPEAKTRGMSPRKVITTRRCSTPPTCKRRKSKRAPGPLHSCRETTPHPPNRNANRPQDA